jgi:hypothetical protein
VPGRLLYLLLCIALALAPSPAFCDDALPPGVDGGVKRGLDFLAQQQNADGSFGAAQKPAITGLALMAFLASGHTPSAGKLDANIGKFGSNVRAAVDYLLSQAQADGSFGHNEKQMYGQAIATAALAEAYGVEDSQAQRKRIAAALANSVKVIVSAQEIHKTDVYAGGWRYETNAPDSDLSLSGWNVLALRACQDVGIAVPKQAMQRAAKFVMKCYNPDARAFAYQPGAAVTPSMTGVGVLCLHLLEADGKQPPEAAAAAAKTLAARPVDDASQFPYYAIYYAAQAAFQAGDPIWPAVSRMTAERLLKNQQPDGGWPDANAESGSAGRAYSTSMALLTLSISYRLLPVYQR